VSCSRSLLATDAIVRSTTVRDHRWRRDTARDNRRNYGDGRPVWDDRVREPRPHKSPNPSSFDESTDLRLDQRMNSLARRSGVYPENILAGLRTWSNARAPRLMLLRQTEGSCLAAACSALRAPRSHSRDDGTNPDRRGTEVPGRRGPAVTLGRATSIEPVGGMKPEAARALPPQDDQLMSQGDTLEFERRSATQPEGEHGNERRW
jgi:hypothetical protein